MDINTLRGLITGLLLVAFLGIVFYAWSGRNRQRLEEAGRSILDEPDFPPGADGAPASTPRKNQHG